VDVPGLEVGSLLQSHEGAGRRVLDDGDAVPALATARLLDDVAEQPARAPMSSSTSSGA
jgi:hypothetical protein